jgi:hypothetical protein
MAARSLLGNCFWREGFEAAFGPDRMGEKGGYKSRLILPQIITCFGFGFLKALHSLIWGRLWHNSLIVLYHHWNSLLNYKRTYLGLYL